MKLTSAGRNLRLFFKVSGAAVLKVRFDFLICSEYLDMTIKCPLVKFSKTLNYLNV